MKFIFKITTQKISNLYTTHYFSSKKLEHGLNLSVKKFPNDLSTRHNKTQPGHKKKKKSSSIRIIFDDHRLVFFTQSRMRVCFSMQIAAGSGGFSCRSVIKQIINVIAGSRSSSSESRSSTALPLRCPDCDR